MDDDAVEQGVYEHRGWAVFDEDGSLIDADGKITLGKALDLARDAYPDDELVIDAYGMREVAGGAPEAMVANERRRLPVASAMEEADLPKVDIRRVLATWPLDAGGTPLGPGLEEAYSVLRPFFPTERGTGIVERWQDAHRAAEGLLRSNFKLEKVPAELTRGMEPVAVGLNLAPNHIVFKLRKLGRGTICVRSTPECRAMCLVYSGQNMADPYNLQLKIATTEALLQEPAAFCRLLLAATHLAACTTRCEGKLPFVRLNVYSDIPWEAFFPGIFDHFSDLQFYDYTKIPGRKTPANYDLTFSYSGHNEAEAKKELARGRRVAVVFGVKRGDDLPDRFWGRKVVDGDLHDLRPLDPGGVIVGLRWKQPFATHGAEIRRSRAYKKFVVACSVVDGRCVVTETPRFTPQKG